jgi:hypothetical protein
MQMAGQKQPGGMVAVLGAEYGVLETVCRELAQAFGLPNASAAPPRTRASASLRAAIKGSTAGAPIPTNASNARRRTSQSLSFRATISRLT